MMFQFEYHKVDVENKLGIKTEYRVKYNQANYQRVYEGKPEQLSLLKDSEEEPSLSDLVQVTRLSRLPKKSH